MGFGMGFGIGMGLWQMGWDDGIWDGIWDGMGVGILPFPLICRDGDDLLGSVQAPINRTDFSVRVSSSQFGSANSI